MEEFMKMSCDNENVYSIGKRLNSATSKRSQPVKTQEKTSAKVTRRNKSVYPPKEKCTNNSKVKELHEINVSSENEAAKEIQVKCKDPIDRFVDNENDEDPLTVLRKEIQEWRINEILTCRTEERYTRTPSEQRSCNYVASGETTKRQRSPNSASKSHRTYVDYPAATKKLNVLEYLDLCENPLLTSYSRMHSQSTSDYNCNYNSDCYCKIRIPIARQRRETRSSENRRAAPSCKNFNSKTEIIRSANKVPTIPAKPIEDDDDDDDDDIDDDDVDGNEEEELDSKRSSITLPISPVLSPETSTALQQTERLIKDARIQIKEISTIGGNIGRVRNCINAWPDETPLDDENDQLLYIRERVAYKFQEANGWIDRKLKSEEFIEKKMKGKDFSNPKYQSSEERYREFMRQRKLQAEKVGFSVAVVNNEQTKNCSETAEPNFNRNLDLDRRESMKNTKIDTCSVQVGPSINIKADLIARNLLSIHISPDASFAQETANVRTYEINHDFSPKQPSPVRKEKLVKIPNENQTNYETKAKDFNEIENKNSSACTCVSKKVNFQGSSSMVENEKNLENNSVNAENEKSLFIQDTFLDTNNLSNNPPSLDRPDQLPVENSIENQEKEKSIKVEFKSLDYSSVSIKETNDQCTVRCVDNTVAAGDSNTYSRRRADWLGTRDGGTAANQLPARACVSVTHRDRINATHCTPLSVNEIETRRLTNKRRYKEICGKQKSKKDERYKRIDQHFSDLLNKYCAEQRKNNHFTRQDSSEYSDLIVPPFYEPSIDQFDNLLTAYDQIIDNVVLSTKTIDKFLSRAELKNEFPNSKSKTGTSKPNLLRQSRRKEQPIVSRYRSRKSSVKKNINKDVEKIGYNNSRKSFILSPTETLNESGQNEESTESSKDGGKIMRVNDPEEGCSFKKSSTEILPSFQVENNDGSSFDTCSSSSRNLENLVNKETIFQASKQAENFRTEEMEKVKEIVGKNRSDCATLYNVTCSNSLKEILPDTENMERSIVRVVREETRFIEEKVKNVFNLDEIVPLLAKGLLENLRNNISNFQPIVVPNPLPNDAAFMNVPIFEKEENFRLTENVMMPIVVEQTNEIHSESLKKETSGMEKRCEILSNDTKEIEKTDAPMENLFEEENLCEALSKDSTKNTNENASFLGDTISELPQQHSINPNSVENLRKEQISSSSDSLHDCASLQSSKNISGTSSNVVQSSGKIVNEMKQISEINNEVANEEINGNNSSFLCGAFEKDQILSEFYQDTDQRFISSTFNRNYSNLLNQNFRLSSSESAIESKVEASSTGSHSEGEIHMPSSASYSIGEVRMLKKNRSDEENSTDDDITIFLTEQMLASWNESSKALVQSMGEI
ncbi:uncharacterized protein LOC117605980 isoform X2 [Osmia lignaria lignaria]|uniref:uncharacterized protein LOC117605980 isoform X2 n=1 Tax=Osmia lignaria lignaria TaxID=1437193 RepID=UPI00402BE6A2